MTEQTPLEPYVEQPPSLGLVLDEDRGSLPYALLHGESLVAWAAWALGEAEVTPVDTGTPWSALVEAEEPVVLHDPLCPATPPDFLRACVRESVERQVVVVAVRPVTDTLKHVDAGGATGSGPDRDGLLQVTSPVVLPPAVVAALDALPDHHLAALTSLLARRFPLATLEAPASGRRVADEDDVRLLEAMTGPR